MTDKAKKLLMLYEQSGKRKTLKSVPPLTFKGYGKNLKNYRIYGNTVDGESVGDLVESGEHSGEYIVPVKIEGKNLLQNTATSLTINGVTFTVNNDKSITCNGTATGTAAITINTIFLINSTKISGCPMGGSWSSFELDLLNINTNNVDVIDAGNGAVIQNENSYRVRIRIASGYTCNNLTFYPMIRKADITDDTYEPYHAPVTTPIYLPEQIKKVGDEAEYIDFREQKQHFVDGTSTDITLPALPTLSDTNILSVGTAVQPSKVEITGKIKQI